MCDTRDNDRYIRRGRDVPITTVKAWMERLPLEDVLNMDELGLFCKTLPQKGLVEKEKKGRGRKQSKK